MYLKSAKKLQLAILERREEEVLRYLATPAEAAKWTRRHQEYHNKRHFSFTPLLPSVMQAHMATAARALIACNTDTTTPATHVDHPFNIAARHNLKDILNTLIEYNVPLSKDALFWTIHEENAYILDKLLAYGADPYKGSVINHVFASPNFKSLYDVLSDHGIDLNDPLHAGKGYLKTALYYSNMDAAKFLSDFPHLLKDDAAFRLIAESPKWIDLYFMLDEKGAEPEKIVFEDGNTLLHIATYASNHTLIESLAKRNIDIDARNADGQTALHIAVKKKDITAIQILSKAGASPHICDRSGVTPLSLEERQEEPSGFVMDLLQGMKTEGKKTADNVHIHEQRDTAWEMLGENKIAHVETHTEIGKRITDIFNFANKERLILSEDLKQGHQGISPVMPFAEVSFDVLKRAFDVYKSKNGSISEEDALFNNTGFSLHKPNGGPRP